MDSKINNLIIGESYSNQQIMDTFQVANSGGIRASTKTNTIVVFTSHYLASKNDISYQDQWIDGILHYTGQGKKGNQTLTHNNKSLANAKHDEKEIHLFESFDKGKNIYRGIVELKEKPYKINELDFNSEERTVYKFPLALVSNSSVLYQKIVAQFDQKRSLKVAKASKQDIECLAKEASRYNEEIYQHTKSNESFYQKTVTKTFSRDPYIAAYVKDLANGICVLCEKNAPFKDKHGNPFLHSHHINYLSQGGKDVIDNCIVVCPNCHAKIHTLKLSKDKEKLLEKVKNRK